MPNDAKLVWGGGSVISEHSEHVFYSNRFNLGYI